MIFGMTFYQLAWLFVIYSFLGWCVEVIYHAVTWGEVTNRGFLNGPVCPVYGFGVVSVFALINLIQPEGTQMSDLLVYVFGVILATLIELVAGWLLDICFHARWWDYSKQPFNFRGYICLEFSLIWGFAILFVVRIFQKYIDKLITGHDSSVLGWTILVILYVVYFVDFVVTVAVIRGFNKKLGQLDKLSGDLRIVSDKVSEKLGETTIETAQNIGEGRVQAALAKAELRDRVDSLKDSLSTSEMKEKVGSLKDSLSTSEMKEKVGSLKDSLSTSEMKEKVGSLKDSLSTSEMKEKVGSLKDNLSTAELRAALSSLKENISAEEYREVIRTKRAELQKKYEELVGSMTKHRLFGQGRLLRAFPGMKHRKYQDIVVKLKEKMCD